MSAHPETRGDILARFHAMVARGEPIIGGGAGTGLSAKCEEAGGIDLIVIYNSGRFRMAGRGSLAGLMPYGDANAIVMEMAGEVLPVVKRTPVLAGNSICNRIASGKAPWLPVAVSVLPLLESGLVHALLRK